MDEKPNVFKLEGKKSTKYDSLLCGSAAFFKLNTMVNLFGGQYCEIHINALQKMFEAHPESLVMSLVCITGAWNQTSSEYLKVRIQF